METRNLFPRYDKYIAQKWSEAAALGMGVSISPARTLKYPPESRKYIDTTYGTRLHKHKGLHRSTPKQSHTISSQKVNKPDAQLTSTIL